MDRRSAPSPSARHSLVALSALVLMTLVSCTRGASSMPRGWGPITRTDDAPCPNLAGRYVYAGQPVAYELSGKHVPWDSIPAELDFFEVAGSADTALRVTIGYVDGRRHEKKLRKGSPYGGDYHCEGGWLHMGDAAVSDRYDGEVESEDFYTRRCAMRIARGRNGALVSRLDRTDYEEFTVWCGDGCKGFPLPWTFTTRSTWSRAERWATGTPRPNVVRWQRRERLDQNEVLRRRDERIMREEQRLENGPP